MNRKSGTRTFEVDDGALDFSSRVVHARELESNAAIPVFSNFRADSQPILDIEGAIVRALPLPKPDALTVMIEGNLKPPGYIEPKQPDSGWVRATVANRHGYPLDGGRAKPDRVYEYQIGLDRPVGGPKSDVGCIAFNGDTNGAKARVIERRECGPGIEDHRKGLSDIGAVDFDLDAEGVSVSPVWEFDLGQIRLGLNGVRIRGIPLGTKFQGIGLLLRGGRQGPGQSGSRVVAQQTDQRDTGRRDFPRSPRTEECAEVPEARTGCRVPFAREIEGKADEQKHGPQPGQRAGVSKAEAAEPQGREKGQGQADEGRQPKGDLADNAQSGDRGDCQRQRRNRDRKRAEEREHALSVSRLAFIVRRVGHPDSHRPNCACQFPARTCRCIAAASRLLGVQLPGQVLLEYCVMRLNVAWLVCIFILSLVTQGCTILVSNATSGLANDVSAALTDQSDPLLVRDGAPAYLILIDGLIAGSPDNQDLLLAAAKLYSAYASAFVDDPIRNAALNAKARDYSKRVLCMEERALCASIVGPFSVFDAQLKETDASNLPALYGFASAWAGWIQANAGDWNAVADLPKVQALLERVIALDESYADGDAHLYLGVLYTLRPAHMGGLPEIGRTHFERAIELSNGRNLMAKVFFARSYARLIFDRELHDELLIEVVEADPVAPGFTLSNTLAQEQAEELLLDADEYF